MAQKINIDGLEFKQTRKKRYDVYMCMPSIGTQVYNKLEGVQYVTDENKRFVLSGTVGEQWVIDANKLAKTYMLADGRDINTNTLRSCMKAPGIIDWVRLTTKQTGIDINFAAHLPLSIKNYPVNTSWGDVLYANRDGIPHGNGDFLVCASINGQPNLDDIWVVNGEIFPNTYDMRAFPRYGLSRINKELPIPKSLIGDVMSNIQQKKHIIQTIMQGLRQRGHRLGKLIDAQKDDCSFTVNNGLYGVILFINTGNPDEGSNSISVMFHSGNQWTEAVTWFMDDCGSLEDNVNKLHQVLSGGASIDNMIAKVNNKLPIADKDYVFDGYQTEMDKPTYFKKLLKTYEYVKDKLQLYETENGLLTQTENEPIEWRIDFNTRLCKSALPFMYINPNRITVCIQTDDSTELEYQEIEEYFPLTDAKAYQKAFQFLGTIIKELAQQGY